MFTHIIIPTDGSDVATRAVEQGLELARALNAKLTILTVLHPFQVFSFAPEVVVDTAPEHRRHIQEHVTTDNLLEEKVRKSGVKCAHIQAESAHLHEAVRKAAVREGCDLIVMPAHERYGLLGKSVDSETVRLLTDSRLPVLVMH